MTVKRSRGETEEVEILAMANCLMLLSSVGKSTGGTGRQGLDGDFTCKTCNRKFTSFQALGGHRASHKRLKLMASDLSYNSLAAKPKVHECSICGLEFPIGQALGGHMRRHRSDRVGEMGSELSDKSGSENEGLEKSKGERSVMFFFDLNLTPSENDLKFL